MVSIYVAEEIETMSFSRNQITQTHKHRERVCIPSPFLLCVSIGEYFEALRQTKERERARERGRNRGFLAGVS